MNPLFLADPDGKNEKLYRSLRSAINKKGVKKSTIYKRVNEGMTEQEAFDEPIRKYTTGTIEFDGRTFSTFRSLCNFYQVSETFVRGRLRMGYDLAFALQKPKIKSVTIDDVFFESVREAAEFYGVSDNILRYRIRKLLEKREDKKRDVTRVELRL